VLCQHYCTRDYFKFLNVSLRVSHLHSMHVSWECINITLLCPTLLFTLIFGRDLRDSAIRRHAEYKPAYSLAFTVYIRSIKINRQIRKET
jgi:hypothetical protein